MKNTNLAGFLAVPLMAFMLGLPAHAADSSAPTTCKDGTTSTATGRGACSGHGGVQKDAASKAAAAAPAEPAAAPAAPAASGTPTTCKDGTTSMATGRGACSGHGGVQKPSKSKPALDAPLSPGNGRRTGCRYAGRREVIDCFEIGTDRDGEQHRSDRSDRQVQGWYLFQVAAPLRDLFAPRRRRRMADGTVVTAR